MDIVSFMSIEEDEKDLIISFALDDGDGGIRSLILHRTLFYEFIMPDEERGTKVSFEGDQLRIDEEHLNTLECFEVDVPVLRIKSRFRSYAIDARNLEVEEFEQIKQHPVLGYEILRGIRPFREILPAVRHHHESWDGTGYPDGLRGESIPRDAQVLAVADAFDAMVSPRGYGERLPIPQALQRLRVCSGTQFDPEVTRVFARLVESAGGRLASAG